MSSSGATPTVRERVLASRDRFWRPEDFNGYSSGAVTHALGRLERSGELRRPRRGLYWRGSPTPFGMAPPPDSQLVNALAPSRGSGPAGRSAALALGLSTQVPRRETVAVPARAPTSTDRVRFVSRAASTKRKTTALRPAEVALLEVLRDWETLVESPADEATTRIVSLVRSGDIRPERIATASSTEPATVRERLRGLLDRIGRPELAATIPPARSGGRTPALAR